MGGSTGAFGVQFTAKPRAIGTFANPRGGGSCSVDPNNFILEQDETNNNCSNTVTVVAPDLTATKANNVSGKLNLGGNWNWTVTVANTGNGAATFTAGQTILSDNLPNTNITYGSTSIVG